MQDNRYEEEIEIDLVELFMQLVRRWWLIALSAIVFGAAGFLWTKFQVPEEYRSTTELFIMSGNVTKDFAYLITSRDVLEEVGAELGMGESYESLAGKVSVETPDGTRVIEITVTDSDPGRAQTIANKVREVASVQIVNVMALEPESIKVAGLANYPAGPSGPDIPKRTLMCFLIGGFLCCGVILAVYLLDDSIKTPEDVENYLKLSTLGMIPEREEKDRQRDGRAAESGGRRNGLHSENGGRNREEGILEEISLEEVGVSARGEEDRVNAGNRAVQ